MTAIHAVAHYRGPETEQARRLVVAYNATGRRVSLLEVGTLRRFTVPRPAFDRFHAPVDVDRRRLARRLEARRRLLKRQKVTAALDTAKAVVAALRAQTAPRKAAA